MEATIYIKGTGSDFESIGAEMDRESEYYDQYGMPYGRTARSYNENGESVVHRSFSSEKDFSVRWKTSGGNVLEVVDLENGTLQIEAKGRRHGIPWRFLEYAMPDWRDRVISYEYQDTNCDSIKPWETTAQRTITVYIDSLPSIVAATEPQKEYGQEYVHTVAEDVDLGDDGAIRTGEHYAILGSDCLGRVILSVGDKEAVRVRARKQ